VVKVGILLVYTAGLRVLALSRSKDNLLNVPTVLQMLSYKVNASVSSQRKQVPYSHVVFTATTQDLINYTIDGRIYDCLRRIKH
jgi:hypothetical protein